MMLKQGIKRSNTESFIFSFEIFERLGQKATFAARNFRGNNIIKWIHYHTKPSQRTPKL